MKKRKQKHRSKPSEQTPRDVSQTPPAGEESSCQTDGVTEPESEQSVEKPEGQKDWESKYNELLAQFQRMAADYQNYQKRTARQSEQAIQYTRESFAKLFLPVLDNFDHTLEKGADFSDAAAVLEGVRIVYDHLLSTLNGAGIEKIKIEPGSPFDPSLHEALMQEESDSQAPNTIIRELACGYTMNDKTLRPAKVSVARAPIRPVSPAGDALANDVPADDAAADDAAASDNQSEEKEKKSEQN